MSMASDPSTSKSEIARLRWQLERGCEALQRVMNDPSFSASHMAITRRYTTLEKRTVQLAALVGDTEATDIMCDIYNSIITSPVPPDDTAIPTPNKTQQKDLTSS